MIMNVIGVEMGGNNNLVILPHTLCRFNSDLVRFIGSNLTGLKTLESVISDVTTELSVAVFSGHHALIRPLLRAVNGRHVHRLVGLFVVLSITERCIKIFIQVSLIGCFVGVVGVVDNFL